MTHFLEDFLNLKKNFEKLLLLLQAVFFKAKKP